VGELKPTRHLTATDASGFIMVNRREKPRKYQWSDIQYIERVRAANFGPYLGRIWLFTGAKSRYDLVSLGDAQYVMPVSIGSTAREMDTLISADPTSVEYYLGRKDFGCVNLTPQIVGEHELGDGADTWKGVHRFGFI